MKDGPDISRIAALIGDPARANILTALMAGKALTATELANEAGVTPATTSSHLAKLFNGGLIQPTKQGRHKYFALSSDDVAQVLESLMGLAAGSGHLRTRTGPKDTALRKARVCYNHLAGDMGVHLYQSLLTQGHLCESDSAIAVTAKGTSHFSDFGIDIKALTAVKSPLCRSCLDWSVRRTHLAGSLGRALLTQFETRHWAKRVPDSRVVSFTPEGERAFDQWLRH